jgi:tetratricopeptide (TPR) repeat protein
MSIETIRMALGRLQDDPDNESAWNELTEAVTAPDSNVSNDDLERLLGSARGRHEARREWSAVAKLLDIEISFAAGSQVEAAMIGELARIYADELHDMDRAAATYRQILKLDADDETASEALENEAAKRGKWRDLVARYMSEADAANDDAFKSALYASAAETAYRYGGDEGREQAVENMEKALRLDRKNRKAATLGEVMYTAAQDWTNVARIQQTMLLDLASKEERVAAGLRLGRTCARKLNDQARATEAYQMVLDMQPGEQQAMSFLAEAFSAGEQWDQLAALYEDQLKGGGVKAGEELGMLIQIAMVHWRMRGQPQAAEPYFERVRKADPTHAGMLSFFREHLTAKGDKTRLAAVLTDAQRAMVDGPEKVALATEIAKLAESAENAQKAIEQYKAVLRTDPENREARDALKRLYYQAESWNALVELYRQELERTPQDEHAARAAILREIAAIYRDRSKNDAALVTVLTQIVQHDEKAIDAVRELVRVYESLGRWRDLLTYQQKLAELSDNPTEKANLYRSAARRWMDQFSNAQNAVTAYEALLDVEPSDTEAQQKLRELYQKRRAWPQLFTLCEKQLAQSEGAAKVELLQEMAKLAAERLDRGADAIALWKQILELAPGTPGILDTLEKLAEREKDAGTVAEVLERRVDAAPDDNARLAALQKLGTVYAERVKDPVAAARTWRRVLNLSPGHAKALRVLRESYVAAGDWDGLEELYASQKDWEGLVDFLSTAADKTSDPAQKLTISFRAARIFEQELKTPERAARSYERVLSVDAKNERAAAALVPIYEKEEKWARLPPLYEVLLGAASDVGEQIGYLRKLANVSGGPLADKATAIGYARRAYELSYGEDELDLLEMLSRSAGSWGAFVEAVQGRLKKSDGLAADQARALRIKLADVYARELGKLDEAVETYRALLDADPTDAETIQALDALLRANGRKDDLRWLFELRASQAEGEAKAEVIEEWATLEEEVFSDATQAILLLRKVIELDPKRGPAMRALSRLLVATGEHAAAAEVVAKHRDLVEGDERAHREVELASLLFEKLGRPREAFEALVRALGLLPHDAAAIALLAKLVETPETRAEAAAVIVEEYAATGDAKNESRALRVLLESETDLAKRKELYLRLASVEENKLSAPGAAFDVVLRALHAYTADVSLWSSAADLAAKAGRPTDLAEAYRTHLVAARPGAEGAAASHPLPEDVEVELSQRAAALHDGELGDPEGAMPYLERVLAIDAVNAKAFARLKQILTATERWPDLERLYERASANARSSGERVELLNEIALVAEEIMGDAGKAIGYYERILTLDEGHEPSLDALEKLYEREERWKDLAALLERRLGSASGDTASEIRLALGSIYLDRLGEPERSLGHLEEVLLARQSDADARQLVERILEVPALRLRAARTLELVYEAKDEIRHLVRVLEIRREGAESGAEKRELLRRIATLRDERLRDDPGAFATLSELVPLEPEDDGARRRLVDIGRRLGSHEKVASVLTAAADASERSATRGEILMEVARIHEDLLGDVAQAEKVYRRVLGIDPGDASLVIPAAQALGRIYSSKGEHESLAEVLGIEVKLTESPATRRALFERIGTLYETVLGDIGRAIHAWKSRLADDPADVEALAALERLYERSEAWRDLVTVLRAREQSTTDGGERRRTMTKAAETLAGKLDDVPEAINAWRSVLDEFGPERPTLAALEKLYEKAERWPDLAETLEVDLSLAEETADRLDLYARLGDVRRLHQNDLPGALDAYRQALLLDPANARCRAALERMLDLPEARKEAAETLHPLYEADGDAERLLRVLEIQVDTSEDVAARLAFLETAIRTAEGPLGDTGRAFAYAVRGVRIAAAESDIAKWIDTVERLAEAKGSWSELTDLYRAIVDEILDGEVQQNVRLRIGELARTKLGDRGLAVEQYKKALEAKSDDRRAMIALEELYAEAGDSSNLMEILKLRVEAAQDDDEKKKLYYRIADLQKGPLADPSGAISTYEALLDVALEKSAIDSVEALYTQAERWSDLIRLYERQLDGNVGSPADLRVKIATVAYKHAGDVPRAFDELGAALDVDGSHAGAVSTLETLLSSSEDPEHRARAGEMLEPVYMRRADWQKVRTALEARLAASQEPDARRELLTRLATLHEEQLEDYGAALETVAKLFHEDTSDQGVWAELERLAKVASAEKRLAEIYAAELSAISSDDESTAKIARRTGEIYADLGDVSAALHWYRRAHEFEPESRELFDAIDKLLVKEQRHAERVALYRAGLDYRSDQERLAALHTIARLERVELSDREKAIDTYRAALDVDDKDEKSLDALTELYTELGRHRDLADLYLRRAEASSSGETAAPYRLALARLHRKELGDTGQAVDQLEAIVNEVPWHKEAIKELEDLVHDEEHKARVVEILRPLYERADDWRRIVQINEEQFRLATDPIEKVSILRNTAQLWETRGNDELRAFAAVGAAFDLVPEDGETRAELERLAEMLGAWEELSSHYELGIEKASDDVTKRELLVAVAKIYDTKIDDPRRALDAYRRLSELDPTDPEPLESMDTLAVLLADWPTLISVLEKKSEIASDEENASIWRRIAETKLDMLDDPNGAIAAYERALELSPDSPTTVDALISLYEPRNEAKRLVELYQRRVELTDPSDPDDQELRYQLNLSAAARYEKDLSDPREAINVLCLALEAKPGDSAVLVALERLYRSEKMWDELLANLKQQAAAADSKEARVKLRTAIGDLYASELSAPADAIAEYRLVLDDDASNAHAIDAVRKLGETHDELRLDAADVLEPVLRAAGRYEDLVAALELRLRAQSDAMERAKTLRTIATVHDEQLKRPEGAEDALLRALEDTPDDASLHEEIERVVERSNGSSRYCDKLAERAGAIFDATVATDLYLRLGRIAEEKLKDDRRSVEAYAKAVEHAGDTPELLESLDRLYGRLGDTKALADVLERRVSVVTSDKEQADLYHRLATIQIDTFGDRSQGLSTLRQALERAPDHGPARAALEKLTEHKDLFEEAADALEAVYRNQRDWPALARLFEKRIAHAGTPSDRVRLRLDLARVLEEQSGDAAAAHKALLAAFGDDPTEPDVLNEIERLSPIVNGWTAAADALEATATTREDLPSEAARDLWVRIAGWRKDKITDAAGAERAFEQALKQDSTNEDILRQIEALQRAPGRERDLVATLRRLAALAVGGAAADLRREAKALAEKPLGDDALVEAILREMIEADDSDLWALGELSNVREKAGDFKEVYSLLVRQAELTLEADKVKDVRHRAAAVARDKLGDDSAAIELYDTIFEDDPDDKRAADALRALYAKTGRHKDLLSLLSRLIDLAESPAARSALRLESAQICLEKLDSVAEATEHLRAILDEEPGDAKATELLAQLYEKTGRDDDLASLFSQQIDLAKERGDVAAELSYSVKLGEVYEVRLNDSKKAIETYLSVLERDAKHKGALFALARLYEHRGEKAEAAKMLETYLGEVSGEEAVKTALRLADIYAGLKDEAQVRKALERGLDADDKAPEIRKRLLALYEKQQAWAELAALITGNAEMATAVPEKIMLFRKAADIHLTKRNEPGSAADLLEKASALKPDDRDLLFALSDAYTASGRGQQAIVALQKVIESFGGRRSKELAAIHHRLAKAFVAAGEKEKALADLDVAFKIDPGSIGVLRDLGILSLELSGTAADQKAKDAHIDRAQKTFRALLLQKLDDSSPITKGEVFYYLADISHRQGDDKKALQMLERALDNDKELAPAKELLAKLKK